MEREPGESAFTRLSDRQKRLGLVRVTSSMVLSLGVAGLLAEKGTSVRDGRTRVVLFGVAVLIALCGIVPAFGYIAARFVVGAWERRETKQDRVKAVYGSRYQSVSSTLYEDLVRIDPFRRMYSFSGKDKNYLRKYRNRVIDILSAIDEERPTSAEELRGIIFRTLAGDPYGNRWGDVGDEERYTQSAGRLWQELHDDR